MPASGGAPVQQSGVSTELGGTVRGSYTLHALSVEHQLGVVADHVRQHGPGIGVSMNRRLERAVGQARDAHRDLVEQVVLVLEVVVDERLGRAQLVGNALHAGRAKAAFVEQAGRCLEDPFALVRAELGSNLKLNVVSFGLGHHRLHTRREELGGFQSSEARWR